jgi:hypothetical protein
VWIAVRTTGLGGGAVSITWTAVDVYSGTALGDGSATDVKLNQLKGSASGTCDYHGERLFLRARPDASAGLADVTVTVTASGGRTATGKRRMWLGAAVPSCDPGADNAVTFEAVTKPSQFVDPASIVPVKDSDTLTATAEYGGEPTLYVSGLTTGFIFNTTSLRFELREAGAAPETTPIVTGLSTAPTYAVTPTETKETPARCRLPTFDVTADDAHGHTAAVSRTVTLHRVPYVP